MPRKKEFVTEEKLEIARNLFWEKGYNATSLNDLEKTLKINRSSLYMTFGNKHNLFITCLKNYILIKKREYELAAKGESPMAAVKNLIKDIMEKVLIETKTCLAISSTFELARIDVEVRNLLKNQAMDSVTLIKGFLQEAQLQGELSPEKDPELLAYFIVTNFSAMWNTDLLFKDRKRSKQLSDFLIKTICD